MPLIFTKIKTLKHDNPIKLFNAYLENVLNLPNKPSFPEDNISLKANNLSVFGRYLPLTNGSSFRSLAYPPPRDHCCVQFTSAFYPISTNFKHTNKTQAINTLSNQLQPLETL